MEAETINSEVLALTYGAVVRQLLADYHDVSSVNTQLKKMGVNIGVRLVEEFLARTGVDRCTNFQETAQAIAEKALPMFLGVKGIVRLAESDKEECTILLKELPIAQFVEIPSQYHGLKYCNMVAGVIEGALGRVNMGIQCELVKDRLAGAQVFEFSLKLISPVPAERYPFDEND